MSSLSSFLEMGGYGGFVWPAFGLTAAILLALLADSLRRLKSGQRALARLQAESPGRRHRQSRRAADRAGGHQA
jgi:heme exporter protein D